jgi:flagellar biogenesis protein FliO
MIHPVEQRPTSRTSRSGIRVGPAELRAGSLSWLFAVGLVAAQLGTLLARSKATWFAWLCVSLILFGCLTLARFFEVRRHTQVPDGSAVSGMPQRPNRAWSRFTLAAMTLLLFVGLARPPHRSNDIYAYGAYGRLVSEHSISPYTTRPSAFPSDPVILRMDSGWRKTRSVYGPAFTALSAVGMRIAGTSSLIERLWFQTLAAVATGLSALLLKRLSPRHWWLFAFNPVVLIVVAHEGHNDALVGLGILSALWFLKGAQTATPNQSRFTHAAIGCLVFAASIKITAILAFPMFAAWILRHFGWKRGARIGAPWILVCTGLFAATGGTTAFSAFRGLRTFRSTTSLWHLDAIRRFIDAAEQAPGVLALTLPAIALVVTELFVLWRVWHPGLPVKLHIRTYDFTQLVTLALAPLIVFIALGLYILPWYWGWLLAPAVLLPPRLRLLVFLSAAMHSVAYGAGTLLHGTLGWVLKIGRFGAPLAFVVVLIFLVLNFVRRTHPASASSATISILP